VTTLGRPQVPSTERVVEALRKLVVFGVDQSGAYREFFDVIAEQLGPGVPTRLQQWLRAWADSHDPGVVVLTGNAGTGKTAAAEEYCAALGVSLPTTDELVDLGPALVAKDVSGLPTRAERAEAFRTVLAAAGTRQALVCANEGVLRDAAEDLAHEAAVLRVAMDDALNVGAASHGALTIVNVNRQRLTAEPLWTALLDYLVADELWQGCERCPGAAGGEAAQCPMRANAAALRRSDTRDVLRLLFQAASGEAVLTMRETLAVIAYAICGDASGDAGESGMWTCQDVIDRFRDRGANALTAASGYFNLVFGSGLPADARERSPLLNALGSLGAGGVCDLQVDDWLRDAGRADPDVRVLAGAPEPSGGDALLLGTRSPLDRVRTTAGEMTFARLGEIVSISEDEDRVRSGLAALVAAEPPGQMMWRRRVLLEGSPSLDGPGRAVARLTAMGHAPELVSLAQRVAAGGDVVTDLKTLIKGLNYLVTGSADASEGLVVPEPASLFARNPGSFRRARPCYVHAKVSSDRLSLAVPDSGLVAELLDVDHVEVKLVVDGDLLLSLRIGPRMYQAVREAECFRGPVGQGTAEMTDLRGFYGRLADALEREPGMQVADPERGALVRIQLPHFSSRA
jgi:hypothetical protein